MAIPSQGDLPRPILEIALEAKRALPAKAYVEMVANRLSLTQEDLRETTPAGASRFEKNVAWVIFILRNSNLLDTPSRGRYQITTAGREYLSEHIGPITIAEVKNVAPRQESGRTEYPSAISSTPPSLPSALNDSDISPQDRIDSGYRQLQDQLAYDLLDSISRILPDAFERLVIDLLEKMGYGKGQAVGRSRDGGIDGIIDQDALGLEKVYIQAKRWQNQIGDPEIRNFSGSLDAKGASKGVFVTTSTFSNSAIQTAKTISAGNKFIRLIDGPELAKLMLNHDVGVITTYTYKIQSLDENYFSEEL